MDILLRMNNPQPLICWVGLRVQHTDDEMCGDVVRVENGMLRVLWDDNTSDIHTTNHLTVIVR